MSSADMDINAAVGGKVGLSRTTIEAALGINASSDLSERERIALEYADRVSATPVDVPDEFFANLQRLFSEREIVELTSHIAHENYNAKSNRPLRVEANSFCDYGYEPWISCALIALLRARSVW
jgi:alkylhydroperoxidase family enzyme